MPRKKSKSYTSNKAKPFASGRSSVVRERAARLGDRFVLILTDFERAVSRFQEVLDQPYSEIIRDSALQRFEFTVELAWKTARAYLVRELGVEIKPATAPHSLNSPKGVLREAFVQGLIEDEPFWLQMMDHRNLLSHVYNEDAADEIYPTLPKALSLCRGLLEALKERKND